MTLPLIKFALPLFTGYMLFLIISGKLYPFRRPEAMRARPSWLLGLWCGLATSIVMLLVLQLVNPLALSGIKVMLPSAAVLLTLAVLPGLLVCLWYRSLVSATALEQSSLKQAQFDNLDNEVLLSMDETQDQLSVHKDLTDAIEIEKTSDESGKTLESPISTEEAMVTSVDTIEREYDSAFEREYNRLFGVSHDSGAAVKANSDSTGCVIQGDETTAIVTESIAPAPLRWPGTATEYDHAFTVACNSANDYLAAKQLALETTESAQLETINPDEEQLPLPLPPPEKTSSLEITALLEQGDEPCSASELTAEEEYNEAFETALTQTEDAIQARLQQPLTQSDKAAISDEIWTQAHAKIDSTTAKFERLLSDAELLTKTEQKLRIETETHLRITRRALSNLESEARSRKAVKADELIDLENALEATIRIAAKAETALTRETKKRAELEKDLLRSKESELSARRDARKNTAARAKVLTTANKALAFARQTVDARTNAEAKIAHLNEQVKIHQDTISSLIATLDSEKTKSREEVSFLSKQLLQKEIELEKQSLTGGNLTSRLVKKVARARPVT